MAIMESRHAAALALVGWYLITPPIEVQLYRGMGHIKVRGEAPLAKWDKMKSFDSESDCEAFREKINLEVRANDVTMSEVYILSRCIEVVDGPRLKGN